MIVLSITTAKIQILFLNTYKKYYLCSRYDDTCHYYMLFYGIIANIPYHRI